MCFKKVGEFVKRNLIELVVLISSIISCLYFIRAQNFWIYIEKISAFVTILFTAAVIIKYIRKKVWKFIPDKYQMWFYVLYLLAILIIVAAIWGFILADDIPDRRLIMTGYVVITTIFIGVNYIITKQTTYPINPVVSIDSYKNLLNFSDYPIFCTFCILLALSLLIFNEPISNERSRLYENFFAGAVAFQMFFSNFVWLIIEE